MSLPIVRLPLILLLLGAISLAGCRSTAADGTASPPRARSTDQPGTPAAHSTRFIGRSVAGSPLVAHVFSRPAGTQQGATVLVFAAIHGDEPTTASVAHLLIEHLRANPVPGTSNVVIVPVVNPDGLSRKRRSNLNGVDLNRNFNATNWRATAKAVAWTGPKPLSEPETRALASLVEELRPTRILSIHSIRRGRHGVNYDGPARELARHMASHNGYGVLDSMGYPTPGSFGSWAGVDQAIPTITLELPADQPAHDAWRSNQAAILAFLRGG